MAKLFFCCPCQHCRRQNEIDVKSIGQNVRCHLCHRPFVAEDPNSQTAAVNDPVHYWILYTAHQWQHDEGQYSNAPNAPRSPR